MPGPGNTVLNKANTVDRVYIFHCIVGFCFCSKRDYGELIYFGLVIKWQNITDT